MRRQLSHDQSPRIVVHLLELIHRGTLDVSLWRGLLSRTLARRTWAVDARLMQEAGFNVVRLAEFAWSRMEPAEGRLRFRLAGPRDRHARAHGIRCRARHADRLAAALADGAAIPTCLPSGRDGARADLRQPPRLLPHPPRLSRLRRTHHAARWPSITHDHPHVIGWQIDNEFGDRVLLPSLPAAFQAWLQRTIWHAGRR